MSMVIAILGAEHSGKTSLAAGLTQALRDQGRCVAQVGDALREFGERHGRAPQRHEHAAIAAEQTRRIDAAARTHEIVVADTTAWTIAVRHEHLFGERSLYREAEPAQHGYALNLLAMPELPEQRTPEPLSALLRASLARSGLAYSVVHGNGPARLASAQAALRHVLQTPDDASTGTRWQWLCERCGDAACERHLLPRG